MYNMIYIWYILYKSITINSPIFLDEVNFHTQFHGIHFVLEARRRQEQKLAKARGQAREREALWLGLWAALPGTSSWKFLHTNLVDW